MVIDFEINRTFNQQLDLVDPGNCCIKCEDEDWLIYYLIIKTIRGRAFCLEYGPIAPDSADLINNFYTKFSVTKFDEKKLFNKISGFLNDPKKKISSAKDDCLENALDDFPEIVELFQKIQ